jgi:hypothetical protein
MIHREGAEGAKKIVGKSVFDQILNEKSCWIGEKTPSFLGFAFLRGFAVKINLRVS